MKDPVVMWQHVIQNIAGHNPSLAASLAKCKIKKATQRSLDIEVPGNGFTLNMIQREKNMATLRQTCMEITGNRHEIQICFTSDSAQENNQQKKKKDNQLKQKALSHPLVADAIEIFGGKLIDVKIL